MLAIICQLDIAEEHFGMVPLETTIKFNIGSHMHTHTNNKTKLN